MSFKSKCNGFTAWVNFRYSCIGHAKVNNIVLSLLDGFNLKLLVESFTGRPFRRLRDFNGLTQAQRETRVLWAVEELKECEILSETIKLNHRLIAAKSADEICKFLWQLVCYDIHFIWLRYGSLHSKSLKVLTTCPFKVMPPLTNAVGVESLTNILSGLEKPSQLTSAAAADKRDEFMIDKGKQLNQKKFHPKECILEIINTHLKKTNSRKELIKVTMFKDLVDTEILCLLINSIVHNMFTMEVLINDRWFMNLAFQTMSEVSKCTCPFFSEDLIEGDTETLCSYFAFFFMSGYQIIQSKAAVEYLNFLNREHLLIKEEILESSGNSNDRWDDLLQTNRNELRRIMNDYDVEQCKQIVSDIEIVKNQVNEKVLEAMKKKYEIIKVPSSSTVKKLRENFMINLNLTNSCGYYEITGKETIAPDRYFIVLEKSTGLFYCDSTKSSNRKKQRYAARNILNFPKDTISEFAPNQSHSKYIVFINSLSSNKVLQAGSLYLYQIFPDSYVTYIQATIKAIKTKEENNAKSIIEFFKDTQTFINFRDDSGEILLHHSARYGRFKIALLLIQCNANIHTENVLHQTALVVAAENNKKKICKLLIECGAKLNHANRKDHNRKTMLTSNKELVKYMTDLHDYWTKASNDILSNDATALKKVLTNHLTGKMKLSSLQSRCVMGGTLLHAACYHGDLESMKTLLNLGLPSGIRDNHGAVPLHLARSPSAVELLLLYGVDINVVDARQNTALHLRCSGERGKPSCLACIKFLIEKDSNVCARNCDLLTPVHCAAIEGRKDVIELIVKKDKNITTLIESATHVTSPSVVACAIKNNHIALASWLLSVGFSLNSDEPNKLIEKILMNQLYIENSLSTFVLLHKNGASLHSKFDGGNSILHLLASQIDMVDVLAYCIDQECDVNSLNDYNWTPLHFAVKNNNLRGVQLLIENLASITIMDIDGRTAFDLITDYDMWLTYPHFEEAVQEKLLDLHLKQARDLVRTITYKIQIAKIEKAGERPIK